MTDQYIMRALSILLVLGLFGGFVPVPLLSGQAAEAGVTPEAQASTDSLGYLALANEATWPAVFAETSDTAPVYLPLVSRRSPILQTVFGVEMQRVNDASGFPWIAQTDTTWIRRNALLWSAVEATEGQYKWNSSHALSLEQDLINASNKGIEVILIVRSTPEWAQKYAGYYCGPVKSEKVAAFANFMYQAVQRYSAPPYNVKYWQIWNEPDVPYNLVPANSPYGCWGPNTGSNMDQYFDGGYYGDVLKQIYPKIKQADPSANVVLGGLLLASNQPGSLSANFLEGVLRRGGANDGGNYFDIVAFHAYDHYVGSTGRYENGGWNSAWNTKGPVLTEKASFIRQVLAKYGVEKPLMNTEGALICGYTGTDALCVTGDFETTKAYYAAQLYATAIAEGLVANIWYSTGGWRGSQMFDSQMNPLPVYYAYKFARQTLSNATFTRMIGEYTGIKGYEFSLYGRSIWVVWSLDGNARQITLPGTPAAVWDFKGNPVAVAGNSVTLAAQPLYLEW